MRPAFTGKETDCETVYSYFGARYYDPTLLTSWTAVDPMADKYPSLSPYNYCAWNPIKIVDPDGRDGEVIIDGENHTINVTCNIYYLESDFKVNGAKNFVKPYQDNQSILQTSSTVYGKDNAVQFPVGEGNDEVMWTISFTVNYISCQDEKALNEALKNDPYANRMTYQEESETKNITGSYINKVITLFHAAFGGDGKTMAHETGHGMGLLHPEHLKEGPYHGDKYNGNSNTTETGGIMSYAANRQLNYYEASDLGRRILTESNSISGTYGLKAHQPKGRTPYIKLTKIK